MDNFVFYVVTLFMTRSRNDVGWDGQQHRTRKETGRKEQTWPFFCPLLPQRQRQLQRHCTRATPFIPTPTPANPQPFTFTYPLTTGVIGAPKMTSSKAQQSYFILYFKTKKMEWRHVGGMTIMAKAQKKKSFTSHCAVNKSRLYWWWLFSSRARILGECLTIHSPPALFLGLKRRLAHAH